MVKKYMAPLSVVQRWGHLVFPRWEMGPVTTGPSANSTLVQVTPTKRAWVYGLLITADEGNSYRLRWTSGGTQYYFLIKMPSEGTLYFVDLIPMNEGLPADPNTSIAIVVENQGAAGARYQAALFYGGEIT